MFSSILATYQDTIRFFAKQPGIFLLLWVIALVHIPYATFLTTIDTHTLQGGLLWSLFQLAKWTVIVCSFWLVFRANERTSLPLFGWLRKYYLRGLIQYVGGFFLLYPVYTIMRKAVGGEAFESQPVHSYVMVMFSIWDYFVFIGTLWLCHQNDGFFQNIRNAFNDVFRNFGFYLLLRLTEFGAIYLSKLVRSGFPEFSALACGLVLLSTIFAYMTWFALVFGFLHIRNRSPQTSTASPLNTEN